MFDIARHVVRYGDLKPCRTAFIDAHTPGSDRKENFTIVGDLDGSSWNRFSNRTNFNRTSHIQSCARSCLS